ncbi:hypothetical protein FNPHOIGM_00019 [Dickeya phage DchS19]|uniref:HNH nuclease domain-containing protein n=1 Tax=Dickeya phage DchS19 TaxID=2951194 RepID=A0A9E7LUX7_9CAUD|nr:hypothetical protein FNPHOIGM_00019 [Dickeya phage DchS19]
MNKPYKQIYGGPRRHVQVWIEHNGPVPEGFYVDHIDNDPTNDDISNLRLARPHENSWNSKAPSSNKTGLKGLSWDKSRERWRGAVKTLGKQESFRSADLFEVCCWIISKRRERHGQFARIG